LSVYPVNFDEIAFQLFNQVVQKKCERKQLVRNEEDRENGEDCDKDKVSTYFQVNVINKHHCKKINNVRFGKKFRLWIFMLTSVFLWGFSCGFLSVFFLLNFLFNYL